MKINNKMTPLYVYTVCVHRWNSTALSWTGFLSFWGFLSEFLRMRFNCKCRCVGCLNGAYHSTLFIDQSIHKLSKWIRCSNASEISGILTDPLRRPMGLTSKLEAYDPLYWQHVAQSRHNVFDTRFNTIRISILACYFITARSFVRTDDA